MTPRLASRRGGTAKASTGSAQLAATTSNTVTRPEYRAFTTHSFSLVAPRHACLESERNSIAGGINSPPDNTGSRGSVEAGASWAILPPSRRLAPPPAVWATRLRSCLAQYPAPAATWGGLNGRPPQPPIGFVEDGTRAGRTTAGNTHCPHRKQRVEVANATGRLHLHARRGVLPHQSQILHRGAASAVAGGGLHPVNPKLTADLDLPPLNGTTSRERIWGWSKPREATNATRKEGTG